MFGKPEWFKETGCCQGLTPASNKGWLYLAIWGALIVLPTAALGLTGKIAPEALIWLAFSTVAFLGDMRSVRRQLQVQRERNLFFIGGEDHDASELATRQFDMKLRG